MALNPAFLYGLIMKKRYETVLSIAGFDGTGGAGLQADLKTFSALGCYGLTVITSLAIQNTTGVKKVYTLAKNSVADQLKALLEDIEVNTVKIPVCCIAEKLS